MEPTPRERDEQRGPTRLAVACIGLGIVLRALYAWLCLPHLRLVGDERFYFDRTDDLLLLFTSVWRGAGSEASAALDRVVGNGWFMPGMSVVLLPARLLTDDVTAVRLYVGALNLALAALLVARCDRAFGRRSAAVLAGGLALLPILVSYTFVLWGELIAGQLALLVVVHLESLRERVTTRPLAARHGALLGLVLVSLVYVRPSLILMLPLVLGVVLAQHLAVRGPRAALASYLRFALPAVLAFALGLAPWSWALSSRMDGFFLTTTSIELNKITAFAPRELFAQTPMESVSAFTVHREVRRRMEREGVGYKQALAELSRTMLADVDLAGYRAAVRRNLDTYLLDANGFSLRSDELILREAGERGLDTTMRASFLAWLRVANAWLWYPLLAIFLLGIALPLGLRRAWSTPVAVEGMFWAVGVQPFVSAVHLRHWVALVPIVLFGVAVACGSERPHISRPRDLPTPGHRLLYAGELFSILLLVVAIVLCA